MAHIFIGQLCPRVSLKLSLFVTGCPVIVNIYCEPLLSTLFRRSLVHGNRWEAKHMRERNRERKRNREREHNLERQREHNLQGL